jgi:ubiquinone/menaquinone biosynthesis C-methylase UbiE
VAEAPTTRRVPAGDYPILPAANRHWLTPFYDLGCELMGLGRSFQRDVLARLGLSGGEQLLDVGCGSGTFLAETLRRYPGVAAAGVDADPEILEIATRRLRRHGIRVTLHVARAEALPFPDESFDVAVSTLTFHHLPSATKRTALAEVYRVLRPGGRLLLVDFGARPGRRVPWWQRLFETVEYLEDNVRGLLPRFLADVGFVDVRPAQRRFPGVEYLAAEKPVLDRAK